MTRVYPNGGSDGWKLQDSDGKVEVLTVWRKSLLFNCNGFTVFNAKGNLVFRVDNYVAGNKGEIFLMDAAGKSLLTIRRKKLSLGDHWLVFDGEGSSNPLFSVKKNVNFLNPKSLAYVTLCGGGGSTSTSTTVAGGSTSRQPIYVIEGSYCQRSCAVYDDMRRRVAEVKRKESVGGVAFGIDVFRLVVQPELDPAVAMSLVILLEQMFGSRSSS